MPIVLLTRSEDENEIEAVKLLKSGFDIVSMPLLSYKDLDFEIEENVSHAIVTSKHAARLIADKVASKLECWVVGSESAKILSSNPKIEVTGVAKNVKELLGVISMIPEDEAGDFFKNSTYYSSDVITWQLPAFINRQIIYNVSYLDLVSEHHLKIIKKSEIKYILVYSKNCAINLMSLIKRHALLPYLEKAYVVAISSDVAQLCNLFSMKLAAANPSFENILELLIENEQREKTINSSK